MESQYQFFLSQYQLFSSVSNGYTSEGIDSGSGSLKVIINLFKPAEERYIDRNTPGTYSEINTTMILRYVVNCIETHLNFAIALQPLSPSVVIFSPVANGTSACFLIINKKKFFLVTNLKLLNILIEIYSVKP